MPRPPLSSFFPKEQIAQPPVAEVAPTPVKRPSLDVIFNPPVATLPKIEPVPITQEFGQASNYDVMSGGVNYGVDYATPEGTDVILPEDDWEVEDAYNQAPLQGFIGDSSNRGYGNSVLVKNARTGEKLRLSHLSQVDVTPGSRIKGGRIGKSGQSGNVTGSHLDAEYMDPEGNLRDILQTSYANIIPYIR